MSTNTLRAYRSDLMQFFEWFRLHGPSSLTAMELAHLTDYLQSLHERNMAASTIARHLVSIKMFFRFLVLEAVLTESGIAARAYGKRDSNHSRLNNDLGKPDDPATVELYKFLDPLLAK